MLFFWSLKMKIKIEVTSEKERQHLKWLNISHYPECVHEDTRGLPLDLGWKIPPAELWALIRLCAHSVWWEKLKRMLSLKMKLKVQCFESWNPKHISMEGNVLWKLIEEVQPHAWRYSSKQLQISVMLFYVVRIKLCFWQRENARNGRS